ncbi:MAG: hypothetical protein H6994_03240 [Pseudomonadales bacterium]|nr:hypothetical protein [Pseudomonadales bacterium]
MPRFLNDPVQSLKDCLVQPVGAGGVCLIREVGFPHLDIRRRDGIQQLPLDDFFAPGGLFLQIVGDIRG